MTVNSPESFGLFPGDSGYSSFETDFPEGDKSVPAPDDFQEHIPSVPFVPVVAYDHKVGKAWKLRGEGRNDEADAFLIENGIRPEDQFGDGK